MDYTEAEAWAFEKLAAGHVVDFSDRVAALPDPNAAEAWPEAARIRLDALAHFIENRAAENKEHRINIRHAELVGHALFRLPGRIDLWLTGCRFVQACWLSETTYSELYLDACVFQDGLSVTDCTLEGGLRSDATYFRKLGISDCQSASAIAVSGVSFMSEARMHRQIEELSVRSCKLGGLVYLHEINIGYGFVSKSAGQGVSLHNCTFFNMSMDGLQLDEMSVLDSQFSGIFSLADSQIARAAHLDLRQAGAPNHQLPENYQNALGSEALYRFSKTEFKNDLMLTLDAEAPVDSSLREVKVGGRLTQYLYAPSASATYDHMQVAGDCDFSFGETQVQMSALGLTVGRHLHLSSGVMTLADFRNVHVALGWRLGGRSKWPLGWAEGVSLDLAGADIGWLDFGDDEKPLEFWPERVNLKGLKIRKLLQSRSDARELSRDIVDLAKRDTSGFAQPYTMLAGLFAQNGDPETANALLRASKRRQEQRHWANGQWGQAFGIFLQRILIGYGIGMGYWRILPWLFLISAIGAGVLHWYQLDTGVILVPGLTEHWVGKFVASVDTLLPIIKLDPAIGDAIPKKITHLGARSWFWVQTLLGWAFGSILGLALAGLTQKGK